MDGSMRRKIESVYGSLRTICWSTGAGPEICSWRSWPERPGSVSLR